MEERQRLYKQILIAFIYVLFWTALGTSIYFFLKPKPEPIVVLPKIDPIQIVWAKPFALGSNLYSVGAKILNPNTNWGTQQIKYTFHLYDVSGRQLTTRSSETFIWPGETKYLIEGGFNLNTAPVNVILSIEKPSWVEVKNFKGVDLITSNKVFRKLQPKEGGFFQVNANVSNNTAFNFKEVIVSTVVFNEVRAPITVNQTVVDNLRSGESRPVPFVWFVPFEGNPVDIDVSATTNIFALPAFFSQ